jgi:hypothetical protein
MSKSQEPAKLLILKGFFVVFLQQSGRYCGGVPGGAENHYQPKEFTFLTEFFSSSAKHP